MLRKIDGDWPRREHFRHFLDNLRCTYSLTVQIDVTALQAALKANGLRTYPAHIYALARAVNTIDELRMGLTESGEPGIWDTVHPSYAIFRPDTKTFSVIWTHYDASFARFYKNCTADIERYAGAAEMRPKKGAPANVFDISSLPWIEFSAFNLNIFGEGRHLLPIFTIGRYATQNGKTLMPLAIQLHHAACDGYHAGLLVEALSDITADCKNWL